VTGDRRFSAIERLLGISGAQKISQSHVVVVGIGGVGSWAAESLARSGVGRLMLIDLDHVAESNINRQIHATEQTLGQAKVHAMRERIHAFFPQCEVTCVDDFATASNWQRLVPPDIDALIDACDQSQVKTFLAYWATVHRKIFVASGAAGGKRHAHHVDIDDLSRVTHDPLLAKVRYALRRQYAAPRGDKKMGVTCVFSREAVSPPDASCNMVGDGSLNCHGFGSLVTVTATFGQCAAGYVLNQVACKADVSGAKVREAAEI